MKLDYFTGEISIPNLFGDQAANIAIQQQVNDLITDYEAEFLKLLLGYYGDNSIYESYVTGVAAGTTQWTDLQTQIYNETTWRSPAAYYIFYKLLGESNSMLTGFGESTVAADNVQRVTTGRRMVRVWNRMCDMIDQIYDWIEDDDDKNFHAYDFDFTREDCYTKDHNGRARSTFEKINDFGI